MGKGGDSGDQEVEKLLEDPRFSPFLSDGFNVADFTSRVLAGSHTTAQAQAEQLRSGILSIQNAIGTEVTSRSTELLSNVRRLGIAENSLQDVSLSVGSLQSALQRIRGEIVGPYETVKTKTRQLRNLQGTIDTLRQLIHRMKLVQKLKAQLAAPAPSFDLAKAAKLITDIRAVDAESDLSGIDVVSADTAFLQQSVSTVQQQAESMLQDGMETLSQAKVGSALQVFFNLEELHQAVATCVGKYVQELDKQLRQAVDSRQLGVGAASVTNPVSSSRTTTGAAGSTITTSWQEKLWSGVREALERLQSSAIAVWHLQRVIAKKKDPLTHVCFLDVLVKPDEALLCARFWSEAVGVMTDAFASASKAGKGLAVRDTLTNAYPRLAQLLEATFDRLSSETTMKGVLPAVGPGQLKQLMSCVAPFEAAYRNAILSRTSDAVASAFPGGSRSLPSPADVQKCIGVMHEELRVVGSSPHLAGLVATEMSAALQLLARKAEYMAATGPDLRAIADSRAGHMANPSQLRNISLCSQLQEVHRSLSSGLLPRLPSSAATVLAEALTSIQSTAVEAVAPLFKATVEALEDRLIKLHALDLGDVTIGSSQVKSDTVEVGSTGGAVPGVTVVNTSQYLQECVALIVSFRSEFLTKFVPIPSPAVSSCVVSLMERMASRLLLFFVRHASLARPLGPHGKLQVAKDLAELQLAVGQNLYPLEQLNKPFRVVKAFRALMFQDTSGVLTSPLIRELPATIILHHLFSRLPASIKAPHERSGLSLSQYSLWLDQHTESDVFMSVEGALDDVSGDTSMLEPDHQQALTLMQCICRGQAA
ncbi:hypothetical protein CEUSTIGMA_g5483.t1 [Chlamydomonas eustigma]|uniref:Conserved oligomeric Golgi complex subunit 5 n=1 Tax=Chlamydomonas eustigma TaxID=1157962 RepID=A0A250X4Q5_9CHLO|nr:hypothetical protein CEUSTIGMA_g5483.t1 [Chlamydomonas eustigma]|eukprot:GAX78041.1 hypothetical protein CEUSTIGMA_g5483.t1 [Chlamydomonas eustigma]